MEKDLKIRVTVLIYAIHSVNLMMFLVLPAGNNLERAGTVSTIVRGVLFGLFAYANYDFTYCATLNNWPGYVALGDMAWG